MNGDDEELMGRLRQLAATVDPMPEAVARNARAALSMRRIDDEIAALLMDSALEPELVRSGTQDVRLLTFEATEVTVDLQVEFAGGRMSLRGLVAGGSGEVTIEVAETRTIAAIDEAGWFAATGLPRGVTRLRLRGPGGRSVATSWVLL